MALLTVVQFGSSPWQARQIYNTALKDITTVGKCSNGIILIILIISNDMILLGFVFKLVSLTWLFAMELGRNIMFAITSKNLIFCPQSKCC